MNTQHATRLLAASPAQIRHALLDPHALPDWNPAFRSVGGPDRATTGIRYPLTALRGLSGFWEYSHIDDREIGTAWQVQGFRETGMWRLRPHLGGTVVTHEFAHEGPLARILAPAYRGVAELRLDRLAERAQAHAHAHAV